MIWRAIFFAIHLRRVCRANSMQHQRLIPA
nr:MAG TPA: hypothetical protein [Caudoviricetes sp.]